MWTRFLAWNCMRLQIELPSRGKGQTQKCKTLYLAKLSFILFWPRLSFFFPECLHCCCYIYFHCSYTYNYYNYMEPCALNAEFHHFIPRFNQTSLLCRISLTQRGDWGWKEAQRRQGCYIYFHCSYTYNYYNYMEPCALNAGVSAFHTQI